MREAGISRQRSRMLKYDGVSISWSQEVSQGVNRKPEDSRERQKRVASIGLHFCSYYKNLVRYNAEFCARCPFNGLRDTSASDPNS